MKSVLVISYYWPPSGGAGVQRWLKFVKYLRNYGWEPMVYTPENPESPETDNSLYKDIPENLRIIKQPIWEPYNFYKQFIGKGKKEKIQAAFLSEKKRNSFTEGLSVWIRGNLFIPDARKFWIRPSVRFLLEFLLKNPADLIISTGPPHSMHWIAKQVSETASIPWIADFRDPWTNIDFYKDLKLTSLADRKHHYMELEVLRKASAVIVISESMANDFNQIYPRSYEVITNGFDEDDLEIKDNPELDKKFSIAHIGTLVSSRNPVILWDALKSIIDEETDFCTHLQIKLAGRVDFSVMESIEQAGLTEFAKKIDYLPHDDVIKIQQRSQVLLLLVNNTPNAKSILTGKIFEYLAAKRPILCIAPTDGDAAKIIIETNSGLVSDFTDLQTLKKNILIFYHLYLEGKLISQSKNIERYSRKALTGRLAVLMNKVIGTP
jgi:glycosyltransferase involved in cell wall biosynthesis